MHSNMRFIFGHFHRQIRTQGQNQQRRNNNPGNRR